MESNKMNTAQRIKSLAKVMMASVAIALIVFTLPAQAGEPSYKINPGDVLRITVWNEENLQQETLVRPDGYISFQLAGEIEAGGKTPGELEKDIAEKLGKYLKDIPTVTAAVQQLNGYKISVIGKVNRPGEFPINSPTDVMQALALAGGLGTYAAENKINVLRRNANGVQIAIPFRYSDVKGGEDLDTNILLKSGDVVVVP
jgi:polysaccharide export outer membrane protein